MYSEKVMEHFYNPRNVGYIDNPDGYGKIGNPTCGDLMELFIKVEDEIITDIKFRTFGCGAAIATSSMVTELVKGKTVREALKITNKQVAKALDGLPAEKMHCSVLGEEALEAAIYDYLTKSGTDPELIKAIEERKKKRPANDHR
jgi:nitrogen fixation NifU-like protein